MKKYALIAICCLSPLLSLSADQCKVNSLIQEKVKNISFLLSMYEIDGYEYQLNFDYHVGYMRGQLKAYQEVQKLAEQ